MSNENESKRYSGNKGPNVVLRVDPETLGLWDDYCEKSGISRSELIRQAVNEKISKSGVDILDRIDELLLYYTKGIRNDFERKFTSFQARLDEKH